ncbi:DASH complex subunit Dad3-domain-containing protein [Pisolithus orientalis]|uniref:DASH complex subunit Dad3-domain-containing protein n=1 Tax=Pisolithus orientalis TaxID=936130 RepID=UPI0022255D57|nr:DASH complex subunit Dad3-domain-containing protein [Pisolithus orientalis]KAI6019825.1 DASH complex subunit Dad3-domain-containing protein [Pisolithus orientalis]
MSTNHADIFNVNPYEAQAGLSTLESEVLWEYAKLAQHVRLLTAKTKELSEQPDQNLVARLRVLERKMGLVSILFKASVWGVINEQSAISVSEQYADETM